MEPECTCQMSSDGNTFIEFKAADCPVHGDFVYDNPAPIVWVVVEQQLVFEAGDPEGAEFPGLMIAKVHSAHISQGGAQKVCRTQAHEAGDTVAMFHCYPVTLEP